VTASARTSWAGSFQCEINDQGCGQGPHRQPGALAAAQTPAKPGGHPAAAAYSSAAVVIVAMRPAMASVVIQVPRLEGSSGILALALAPTMRVAPGV
jgi:hypothetical protein